MSIHMSKITARPHDAQVELIHEITKVITNSLDLRSTLQEVLEHLHKFTGMNRGTISLLDPVEERLHIEVAHGLSTEAKDKGRYRIGEGITGTVAQTGQAVVVPRIDQDPRFLDRTGARSEVRNQPLSFICVPIKLGGTTIGALSVDKPFHDGTAFEDDVRLLNIVASIVAQAVKLSQTLASERARLVDENLSLRQELAQRYQVDSIIGNSGAMAQVHQAVRQVAPSQASVMIRGESGTGKELVAHAIHFNSARSDQPFVKVNCAALPENLLESELFGHEKGAFTGAIKAKPGRFERADGGTLFLDEIGDLSPATQVKMLRVLQFKEFERLGATEPIRVDVRLVVATNRDLEDMVHKGKFRDDLYYRINVFPIYIPPLRERKDDIIQLADHFLLKYASQNGKSVTRISTPAINMLMSYHWPGNVRELENCIERAVLVCDEQVIRAEHLPPSLQTAQQAESSGQRTLPQAIEQIETEMILESLKRTGGHQGKAAQQLGITERVLGYKIRKYHIEPRIYSAKLQRYTKT